MYKKYLAFAFSGILGLLYSPFLEWSLVDLFGNPKGKAYSLGNELNIYRMMGGMIMIIIVISLTSIKYFVYKQIYNRNRKKFLIDMLIFFVAVIIFIPIFFR